MVCDRVHFIKKIPMIVTSLKEQVKNKDRVSVFVDSKYSFSLTISELLDTKLKVGQEIDEVKLKSLKNLATMESCA